MKPSVYDSWLQQGYSQRLNEKRQGAGRWEAENTASEDNLGAVCQKSHLKSAEVPRSPVSVMAILYVLDYELDRLIAGNAQLGRTHLEKRDASFYLKIACVHDRLVVASRR